VPLVSVIVIGYNDAGHLPTAVRSVIRQTLRDIEIIVVDDASTDHTPRVTAHLAATDPRITVIRRATNSGGCSAPRNDGLAVARGRYVTFCDSDDVMTRRACERLVAAAESSGADLACGRYVRRHHDPTRYVVANERLFLRPAVLDGILDRPEQLHDTPAWAKLYRRAFIERLRLRFPEGLLYEDLLFVTEAYCQAERIAIVPDLTYVWNVRRNATVPSITNRQDLRNWHDRLEVHRRIDDFLDEHHAGARLQQAKDAKFLASDMTVYLRELRACPPGSRPQMAEVAADYCAGLLTRPVLAEHASAVPVGQRIAALAAANHDLPALLAAADLTVTGSVSVDLEVSSGRARWTSAHKGDPVADAILDVTAEGWHDLPWQARPYLATVTEARVDGDRLALRGWIRDIAGGLAAMDTFDAQLRVTSRVGEPVWTGPCELVPDDDGARFNGAVDLVALGRRLLRPTIGYELRVGIELRGHGSTARRALSARDADLPAEPIALVTPWKRLIGDRAWVREANGRLVVQFSALPRAAQSAIGLASRARYGAVRARARYREVRRAQF
jgi:CDP-glycerol glycerophosphotransferase